MGTSSCAQLPCLEGACWLLAGGVCCRLGPALLSRPRVAGTVLGLGGIELKGEIETALESHAG